MNLQVLDRMCQLGRVKNRGLTCSPARPGGLAGDHVACIGWRFAHVNASGKAGRWSRMAARWGVVHEIHFAPDFLHSDVCTWLQGMRVGRYWTTLE